MTLKETLAQLESLGDKKVRAQNEKHGAGDNPFGVRLGDIRKLDAKIKTDHNLGMALWETGNFGARLLAILIIDSKALSRDEMDRLVRSGNVPQVRRHRREIGSLSRLSGVEGVHFPVCADLDRRNGAAARLKLETSESGGRA